METAALNLWKLGTATRFAQVIEFNEHASFVLSVCLWGCSRKWGPAFRKVFGASARSASNGIGVFLLGPLGRPNDVIRVRPKPEGAGSV